MDRTLVLIRHAKSDWGDASMKDYDRPLNERGKRDAPEMGRRLRERGVIPDLVLASPARRTTETARLILKEMEAAFSIVRQPEMLYQCPAYKFEDLIISSVGTDVQTLFVIAHNPGISQFASDMVRQLSIDSLSTCGLVALRFDGQSWLDFTAASCSLLFYDYPKKQ